MGPLQGVQVLDREQDPDLGPIPRLQHPVRVAGAPPRPLGRPPRVDEHGAAVREWLAAKE
jgi:hypothetical protein